MVVKTKETIESLLPPGVHHEFQPLWNLKSWSVFGYEGLFRSESDLNPEEAFSHARSNGYLYEMDTYSLRKAIETFPNFNTQFLFLNVYPSTVLHRDFQGFIRSLVDEHPRVMDKLILELNETSEEEYVWHIPALKDRINWLQDVGIHMALDDLGKGAASLQKIIEFQPRFVKLDRYFSQQLSESMQKQKMVELLTQYCIDESITLIIEGIEKPVDLALAKMLNVPIGQGYLMGRPSKL
ncbi:EAL domain-containing protein [Bacillus sp. AK031]